MDKSVSTCLSIGVAKGKGADKGVVLCVQSCAKDFEKN